jgi:hypothetical protein
MRGDETMPRYEVINTTTEQLTHHKTWRSAFDRVARNLPGDNVVVVEIDKDGERTYDRDGNITDSQNRWNFV